MKSSASKDRNASRCRSILVGECFRERALLSVLVDDLNIDSIRSMRRSLCGDRFAGAIDNTAGGCHVAKLHGCPGQETRTCNGYGGFPPAPPGIWCLWFFTSSPGVVSLLFYRFS